jgi:hypothetical protein
MKKIWIASGVVLILTVVAIAAFAMPFGRMRGLTGIETGPFGLFHTNLTQSAIENGDYAAYLSALDEGYQAYRAQITEERFNKMVEQRSLMNRTWKEAIENGTGHAQGKSGSRNPPLWKIPSPQTRGSRP